MSIINSKACYQGSPFMESLRSEDQIEFYKIRVVKSIFELEPEEIRQYG